MRVIMIKSAYDGTRVIALVKNYGDGFKEALARLEEACKGRGLHVEAWEPDDMSTDEAVAFVEEEYPRD